MATTDKNLQGLFPMVDGSNNFGWRMGVKRVNQGWLDVNADEREVLLAQKRHLLETQHPQTVAFIDDMDGPCQEILDAVSGYLRDNGHSVEQANSDIHPLEFAARHTVEDLVVMVERDGHLVFGGGVVCFPNRWDLPSKLGKTMAEVHSPVPFLNEQLGARIDGFLRNLPEGKIFERGGWGVIDTPVLFQPWNPNTAILADDTELYVRVERETLRRFVTQNAILFTIHTSVHRLNDVLADPKLAHDYTQAIQMLPPAVATYKNISTSTRRT